MAKIKCPKCGFEDEGKFCSNCGSPLSKSDVPVIPDDVSWLDKCPVCKTGNLSSINKKKLFGLSKEEKI